jgi:hypothetical protein
MYKTAYQKLKTKIWIFKKILKLHENFSYMYCLFVWWCLMPLSTILQVYRGVQYYWWRKPEDPEKTTDYIRIWSSLAIHYIKIFRTTCSWVCNQCLSPLMLWVWIPFIERCTRYNSYIMWYAQDEWKVTWRDPK